LSKFLQKKGKLLASFTTNLTITRGKHHKSCEQSHCYMEIDCNTI